MAFVCNECHETWPDKDNQLDNVNEYGNEGLCPNCAEDEEHDEGSHPWSGRGPSGSRGGRGRR